LVRENHDVQDRAWRRGRAGAGGDDCHQPRVVAGRCGQSDQPPFEETWRDAALPLVFKSAALASITAPKIVQVEPVKMEPDVVMLLDPPESKPVAKRKPRHVELDVCRGTGKRYHGRSWKCRR